MDSIDLGATLTDERVQPEHLIDVARGKQAIQSSLSDWSSELGASGILAADVDANFGIHSELENSPWWQVDLAYCFPLSAIVIHNRRDGFQSRARSAKIEISRDAITWQLVHAGFCHFGAGPFGDPLRIPLGGYFVARHVRISLCERTYLHLSQVEVLVAAAAVAFFEIVSPFGLDVDLASENPDDPTFYTGYKLRSAVSQFDKPLVGLSIVENGAFGNCMLQYLQAVFVATRLGLRYIKISERDRSEVIRVTAPLTIKSLTFIPATDPLPPQGSYLHGNFFDHRPFERAVGCPSAAEADDLIRTYVRPVFNAIPAIVQPKPDDMLMVHIRSGDIFDKWVNPAYVQPPLAFYTTVTNHLLGAGKITKVKLVYENKLNPVIDALETYLRQNGIPFSVQTGSVVDDIQALMQAKFYLFGLGTFGPGVCRFSDDVEAVFFFAQGASPGFEAIPSVKRVFEMIDLVGEYIKAGEWNNTPAQRTMMVDYPAENIGFTRPLDADLQRTSQ